MCKCYCAEPQACVDRYLAANAAAIPAPRFSAVRWPRFTLVGWHLALLSGNGARRCTLPKPDRRVARGGGSGRD